MTVTRFEIDQARKAVHTGDEAREWLREKGRRGGLKAAANRAKRKRDEAVAAGAWYNND